MNLIDILQNDDLPNNGTHVIEALSSFINKNQNNHQFESKDYIIIFDHIINSKFKNQQWVSNTTNLYFVRLLQVVRLLTRSKTIVDTQNQQEIFQLFSLLLEEQSKKLNQGDNLEDNIHFNSTIIQLLCIKKRLIYYHPKITNIYLNKKYLYGLLDCLNANSKSILESVIDFYQFLIENIQSPETKSTILNEIAQLFYVGKLLFVLEKYDDTVKILAVNLLTRILDHDLVSQNFRRIQGVATIISEIKKNQNSKLSIKIPLLNCIFKIVQKSQNLYDVKMYGIVPILQNFLYNQSNYLILTTVINIFCFLIFDDDLSLKIMDNCLSQVTQILFDCHPLNMHQKLHFEDVQKQDFKEAVFELQIYCFKMLRFIFSIQKNRGLFKIMFTPRLLQIFIDIGNYVRSLTHYKGIVEHFNQISEDDLRGMEANLATVYNDQEETEEIKQFKSIRSYILLELIGKGAFGSVYLCKKGENKYALKQISLEKLKNKGYNDNKVEIMENFKEVQIQKDLNHPNIVKYYESFIQDDTLCIIMEFVEGFNLSEMIKIQDEKGQEFDEGTIWEILINLCTVLKYMHHEKNIVHRDLNPANIMIDSTFQIKICDFGLAKRLSQTIPNNSFVGTLIYTCPEIVENKEYDEKADIWALGCIIYELATLKAPFTAINALMLAKKIVSVEYEELNESNCKYSQQLIDFIKSCLIYDHKQRPNILQLLEKITVKLANHIDSLKEKQIDLNIEVTSLTKKINHANIVRNRLNNYQLFGMTQTNAFSKIKINQKQLMEMDPVLGILEITKKILTICNSDKEKNSLERYWIEQFYYKVILNKSLSPLQLKAEMQKLISLSKEIYEQKQQLSYEQLYFFIHQLYEKI